MYINASAFQRFINLYGYLPNIIIDSDFKRLIRHTTLSRIIFLIYTYFFFKDIEKVVTAGGVVLAEFKESIKTDKTLFFIIITMASTVLVIGRYYRVTYWFREHYRI